MSKPMIVGEANPYGADPYFAMYPQPKHSAGGRLCRLILKMEPEQYLCEFDRVNLCPEKWSVPIARVNAQRIRSGDQRIVIMLGAKVTRIMGFEFEPFKVFRTPPPSAKAFVCLPHPSGLNRMWHEPRAFELAQKAVNEARRLK